MVGEILVRQFNKYLEYLFLRSYEHMEISNTEMFESVKAYNEK